MAGKKREKERERDTSDEEEVVIVASEGREEGREVAGGVPMRQPLTQIITPRLPTSFSPAPENSQEIQLQGR